MVRKILSRLNEVFWFLAPYIGVVGVIFGTWQYMIYYGWWQALLVSGGCGLLGWMAVEMLYPMWFGGGRGDQRR